MVTFCNLLPSFLYQPLCTRCHDSSNVGLHFDTFCQPCVSFLVLSTLRPSLACDLPSLVIATMGGWVSLHLPLATVQWPDDGGTEPRHAGQMRSSPPLHRAMARGGVGAALLMSSGVSLRFCFYAYVCWKPKKALLGGCRKATRM